MKFEEFSELIKEYNTVPVYKKYTADLISPILAYLNIREKNKRSFLFESVEGIGKLARYSFLGRNPLKVYKNNGQSISIEENGILQTISGNFINFLSEELKKIKTPKLKDLPYFTGGLVGYFGFENVSLIEDVINFDYSDELNIPDAIFCYFSELIIYDHYNNLIYIVSNVEKNSTLTEEKMYAEALEKIETLRKDIYQHKDHKLSFNRKDDIKCNLSDTEYEEMVYKCKDHISQGDVFQIVVSKRYSTKFEGDLFNVYRALRIINPTPYMHYIEFNDDLKIVGTSPEDLLKVKDDRATILPIAGTRKRGEDDKEDLELERNLLNDPKEISEHTMLVDLARNDLGRVCDFNTVEVTEKFNIHRYSHVMHIVSKVEGNLQKDKDCLDALKASFPAGTVSGAPKIKAIQLINKYEKVKRGIYAGAIGYIDLKGNLDLCIAIRTFFAKENNLYWQAGAGIVADSKPKLENKECDNKAAALVKSLKFAEEIDENSSN